MCGISAAVSLPRSSIPSNGSNEPYGSRVPGDLEARLGESLSKISHRGPDAEGIWVSADKCIGDDASSSFVPTHLFPREFPKVKVK